MTLSLRMQRLLMYYALVKLLTEPRVVQHVTGGGGRKAISSLSELGVKDHDLLDGLLDDDHTMYYHTDGTDSVTGDITTTGNRRDDIGKLANRFDNIYGDRLFCFTDTEAPTVKATVFQGLSKFSAFNTRSLDDARMTFQVWDNDLNALVAVGKFQAANEPYVEWSKTGDISHLDGKFTIFDKASGNGIKVDTGTPTFGWRDLLGEIRTRGVGGTDPNDATYNGNIKAYQFSVNDECWIDYHIPHDYVLGTDIHLHFHWSHIGALVTGGNVTWGADITYAKGHDQAPFPASVNTTVVGGASATQYQHMIIEVKISDSTPGASEIDTDDLEPDGVIMIRGYLSANNITVSGGGVPDPFLHFLDVHYQSTNIATKNKVPDFYT